MAMTAANAMILVDQTAVPLALPDIMRTFGVGSQEVQWVLNGSLLPLAGLLVFGGRLGDLIGLRRVFIFGCLMFVTASAVGGLAPAFGVLLAARAAQGAGGALLPDLTQRSGDALRDTLQTAEASGLRPGHLDSGVVEYLLVARDASNTGYSVTFLASPRWL